MIKSYKELLSIYKNQRQVNNAVKSGEYTKISRGIYSSDPNVSIEEYICKRYPNGILTGTTALHYHGLIKSKSNLCYLATKNDATRLKNPLVLQSFQDESIFPLGVHYEKNLTVYDKERMLIELFRNRNKLEPKIFKEAVLSYRKISKSLNLKKINFYLSKFKNAKILAKNISDIVF